MTIPDTVKFSFFDFVWLRIDEDGESPGMGQVIGILFKPGATLYQVQWGFNTDGFHYEAELTKEKPTKFLLPD